MRYTINIFLLLLSFSLFAQKDIPSKPQRLVSDLAGMLSSQQRAQLEQKLVAFDNETSTQIAIVTEKSLQGDDLFNYTQRLADAWGIGGKEHSNGVLVFVATDDRKIRIHTGYGAEGFLPDITSKQIIEDIISPAFRQGKFYQGFDQATNAIIKLAKGEGYENTRQRHSTGGIPLFVIFFILVFMIMLLGNIMGRGGDDDDDDGGYYRGGRYDGPHRKRGGGWIIIPRSGGSFGGGLGGGGGFGGGFGGFGGGGFGGGGASGGW